MNKLHQAYIDLGLQPGAPLADVLDRWRTVARMWHPDRAGSEEERAIAEAELKKVNGARDLLMRHLQSAAHRGSGCECSISSERASQPETPPPPRSKTETGHRNPPPPPPQTTQPRTAGTRPRKRVSQPADPKIMWLVTAGMVIIGWSIVHMNNSIRLRRAAELPAYGSAGPSLNSSSMAVAVQPSAMFAVRPSSTGQIPPATPTETPEQKAEKKRAAEAAPKPAEPPKNQSVINFVSSDGRLVSLKDGTTWELWQQEAADSFFQWQPGDQVIVKGPESTPGWLVNQSRSYHAVKVTPVR